MPQMYLEPGMDEGIVTVINSLAPAISVAFPDNPLNCYIMAKAWERQLRTNGIEVERIGASFLTERGPWGHEYLLVGAAEHIFDPTVEQFRERPEPRRYIVEPGDTDDEPGFSVADMRADPDVVAPFIAGD